MPPLSNGMKRRGRISRSKSGVRLGDRGIAELAVLRTLHFNRNLWRANGNAGLPAAVSRVWSGCKFLKLNYNIQQTYPAAGVNHREMVELFIHALDAACRAPSGSARTSFACVERVLPQRLVGLRARPRRVQDAVQKHQQTYMPYGYSWGMDGHAVCVLGISLISRHTGAPRVRDMHLDLRLRHVLLFVLGEMPAGGRQCRWARATSWK